MTMQTLKKREIARKYYHKHKEKLLAYQKQTRIKRRMKVIDHYGSKCVCCGEKQYEFLSIEHNNGGGTQHRKSLPSPSIDRFLIKNNFPEGYSVLCHNCNFAKGVYGHCPHKNAIFV